MQPPSDELSSLPAPPRPVLPRVRRRAWAEPVVRFWWVLALVLFILAPFVGAGPLRQWQKLSRLADQPPVTAKILKTELDIVVGRPVQPGMQVQIDIAAPPPRQLWGTLDGWANGPLPRIGDTIEIRVDQDDPNVWAVVHRVPPLATALATGIAVAAIALVPLIVSVLLRRRVLHVWQTGDVREAAVVGQQQTALAPGAYALQCVWIDDDNAAHRPGGKGKPDRAVFRVFVPKKTQPAIDDQATVHILEIPGGKRVAADWFNA